MKKVSVRWQIGFLVLILVLTYVLLAGHSIWLPGIYYDEVFQVVPAIATVKGGVNGPFTQVEGSVIHLGRHSFPLLLLPYLGSIEAGIFVPIFTLMDVSVPVIRYTFIALGAISIVLTFYCICALYNSSKVAVLSTLLLLTDPSYLFSTRSDNGPIAIMMICKMGALLLLFRWLHSSKKINFWGALFLCGVGLYDKVNFIWFLVAMFLASMIVYPRQVWERIRQEGWSTWLGGALSFCMGASIFLLYILLSRGGAFRGMFDKLTQPTAFGTSNTDVLSNLIIRTKTLFNLLRGYEVLDFYTSTFSGHHYVYNRGLFFTTLLPWLFVVAIVFWGLQVLLRTDRWLDRRRFAFFMLLILLILIESIFSPTNLMYHHLFMLYPFPHLLTGVFLAALVQQARARISFLEKAHRWVSGIVIACVLLANLRVIFNYYHVLDKTGGVGMWSDAIYELADYLRTDERIVVCMDWGFNLNLLALSEGHIKTIEIWQDFVYAQGYSPHMETLLRGENQVFLFHPGEYAGVLALTPRNGPFECFQETARQIGATVKLEKHFSQRDGDTVYELYIVQMPEQLSETEK